MSDTDVRKETIFTILRNDRTRPQRRADLWWLAVLALTTWVKATVFLGQYRPNQVAKMFALLAPRNTLFTGTLAVAVLFAAGA